MRKVLISACLLGKKVRYDGGALAVADQIVERWRSEGRIVSVCPEVEAGMSIPRQPAEIFISNGQSVLKGEADVIEKNGTNVTTDFLAGASIALDLCLKFNITVAVLAEFSPSCGSSAIYDGSFSGKTMPGMGVTAALLRQHGVHVFNQYEIAEANQALLAKRGD
ncbi:DUF523 domain-containing protein [Halomonas sp. SpR8]|uniref:DUF523 domain-containing protein n=1 Tax=Halomonas sp. SpR8 TaxID=3050463 RepID=UPI0027E50956|nr:DUF523 domain-containing protein [Halomonas sp. SpR8]MDQ7728633.1 DUF523 domain-containing protein [Halomonas sp. SpR8]